MRGDRRHRAGRARAGAQPATSPLNGVAPAATPSPTPTREQDNTVKVTITEALHQMRRLQNVDAGRLRGVAVTYYLDELTDLDRLPAPWGSRLVELIEARKAGTVTADTPHYLVYSDRMPVAWATVHAAV